MSKVEKKWKNGVWQFLIDHSKRNPDGTIYISFRAKDEAHFWHRVRARQNGEYSRTDLMEEQAKLTTDLQSTQAKLNHINNQNKRSVGIQNLLRTGNWYIRTVISIKQWCNNQINKRI